MFASHILPRFAISSRIHPRIPCRRSNIHCLQCLRYLIPTISLTYSLLSFLFQHSTNPTESQNLVKQYTRILSLWPKDALRPEVSFQKTLQHRIALAEKLPEDATAPATAETRNINALYSLLDGRYAKKVHQFPITIIRIDNWNEDTKYVGFETTKANNSGLCFIVSRSPTAHASSIKSYILR